jgi:alpha-glucosidase (family GH31 glycosyl hydrolase)
VIYNDAYSHQEFITALASSSFAGVLWTPEVRSSKTGEEWLRRMQSVCFSPLAMLNAWSDGTKPWSFPEVFDEVREVMQLRTRLLPYFYTAFAHYHFDGTPPFRAMALLDGFVPAAPLAATNARRGADDAYTSARRQDVKDQYLAGDSLLVAPMFAGQTSRVVVLPAGRWYDFYTGAHVGGGELITVSPGLGRIPLFVRDGGVIPMIGARQRVPGAGERVDLEVRHYGDADGEFALYDDDGATFAYENGEYSWTRLRVARAADGTLRGEALRPAAGRPFGYDNIRWTMMPVGGRK